MSCPRKGKRGNSKRRISTLKKTSFLQKGAKPKKDCSPEPPWQVGVNRVLVLLLASPEEKSLILEDPSSKRPRRGEASSSESSEVNPKVVGEGRSFPCCLGLCDLPKPRRRRLKPRAAGTLLSRPYTVDVRLQVRMCSCVHRIQLGVQRNLLHKVLTLLNI